MIWSRFDWILACAFPFVTSVALILAWRSGRKPVLWVLGISLVVAAVHGVATRIGVLPVQWGLMAGAAAVCGFFRAPAWSAAIPLSLGALIFLCLAGSQWGRYRRPTDPSSLERCPLASLQTWYFPTGQPENQWHQFSADSPLVEATPRDASVSLFGTQVPALRTRFSELPRESATILERAEYTLTDEAHRELKQAHQQVRSGFVNAAGFGLWRMQPHMQWPDLELPLACERQEDSSNEGRERSASAPVEPIGGESPTSPAGDEPAMAEIEGTETKVTRWVAERVQLVGLLKSRTPRVYELQGTPRMDELDSVPTRSLDSTESSAIEKLKAGEDLVVSVGHGEIRMIGELRADRSCLSCHSVKEGALLGAFTYRLRAASAAAPPLSGSMM